MVACGGLTAMGRRVLRCEVSDTRDAMQLSCVLL